MSKHITLPACFKASTQAERIYNGKLAACYTGVLAAHAEHRIPSALEAQKLALKVAVAESFPHKTAFLQISPTPAGLLEQAAEELSPYKWLCLLVAFGAMHSNKLELCKEAAKADSLLSRTPEAYLSGARP